MTALEATVDFSAYDHLLVIPAVHTLPAKGYGTVELVNSAPKAPQFSRAPFRFDERERNRFVDARNGVAVIPLWKEKEEFGVLITTPGESDAALRAAQAIGKLLARPAAQTGEPLGEALAAFRKFDFARSYRIARVIAGED